MELLKPIKPAKRKSETNTHFIVLAFGKPKKKIMFEEFISALKFTHGHPNIQEFSIYDINVDRNDEREFIKEFEKINIAGYFPKNFIKAFQLALKLAKNKSYKPIPYNELMKLKRATKHKLLSYFPTLIAYRRH